MTWRPHFVALQKAKAGMPKLDNGTKVGTASVTYTPTTEIGWRDHFADQAKGKQDAETAAPGNGPQT